MNAALPANKNRDARCRRPRSLDAGGKPGAISRAVRASQRRAGGGSRVDGVFYDALERRDPLERESALLAALPAIIAAAKQHAPAYRDRLAKVRPAEITDWRALADLPLTRKSDLIELQRETPPFG